MGRSSIKAFFKATPALFSTPTTVIGMPLDLKGYTPEKYTKKKTKKKPQDFLAAEISTWMDGIKLSWKLYT